MTKEEQARYYQEADRQRQLHKQLYPEWSNGENYVGASEPGGTLGGGPPSLSICLSDCLSVSQGKRKNRKQRKLLSNTWTDVSEGENLTALGSLTHSRFTHTHTHI